MILNPKHFDDMDNFDDFDDKLEPSDADLQESGPNHPLAWRRVIIEKALNNVKKAMEQKIDINTSYKKGELVFDSDAHKFARVAESKPGTLNMTLISGGQLKKGVDHLSFIQENRHRLTLSEMAKHLSLPKEEVINLLNQLELTIAIKKPALKSPHIKKSLAPTKAKASINIVKAKKTVKAKLKPIIHKKSKITNPISFTKLLPKGATTDPIMDPNGYIQQNFLLMSNRELSFATGLSEHTIRRKLGEWNLKRKDFINKA